jgi:hypothetical protein
MRHACLCCGYLTIGEEPPGTFEICPVCDWEDEYLDLTHPDGINQPTGGPNAMLSLREARENFARFGAASPEWRVRVRSPRESEQPRTLW